MRLERERVHQTNKQTNKRKAIVTTATPRLKGGVTPPVSSTEIIRKQTRIEKKQRCLSIKKDRNKRGGKGQNRMQAENKEKEMGGND